jgi:hypothetical protein
MFTVPGGLWKNYTKRKKIKAIGVSNFQPDQLMDLIVHHEIVPAVNQIETHPFYHQREAAKLLETYDIQHESWGPFTEGKNNLFEHDVLVSIGEKYDKTAAQVALRWTIQRDIAAIPKSVHKDRIIENFNIFGFRLDDKDMDATKELDENESSFIDHPFSTIKAVSLLLTFVAGAIALSLAAPVQILMIQSAKGGEMLGASLTQAAFNIGNSLGAFLGGLAIAAGFGYLSPAFVGCLLAFSGVILTSLFIYNETVERSCARDMA